MTNHDLLRAVGILLYVSAIAIVLRWLAYSAEQLPDDDERGLSDTEIDELDIVTGKRG